MGEPERQIAGKGQGQLSSWEKGCLMDGTRRNPTFLAACSLPQALQPLSFGWRGEKKLHVIPGLVLQWPLYMLQFPQMPSYIKCLTHF